VVNTAQAVALVGTAVAAAVLFLVLRYPHLRRPQFQGGKALSIGLSLACALGVFAVFAFLVWR
jgi:hypothetical protein